MKKTLALFASCVVLATQAAVVWETGSYDPASWTPSDNLLRGLESVTEPVYFADKDPVNAGWMSGVSLSTLTLTDGSVPGSSFDASQVVGLSGGTLQWNFDAPKDISEVRIFSRWSDGGRDGICVARVEYQASGSGVWVVIADESNPCSIALNNNASFGAYCAALKDSENTCLAAGAVGLRVVLSDTQDNDGAGYVEIEALGDQSFPYATLEVAPARMSATVSGVILSCGTGADAVSISCACVRQGEDFPEDAVVAENKAVNNAYSFEIPDLRWGTTYQYRIVLRNNLGKEKVLGGMFATESEFKDQAGLWEVRIDGNAADWTTDAWAIEEGVGINQRHRELGAEMAYSTTGHTSTFNGQTYSWADNTVFAYVGFIYIKGDADYTFESSIDDAAYLKIGDTVTHDVPEYEAKATSSWTSGKEGWYPIDLRVGNLTHGAGPIGSHVGFHYSTDGGNSWTRFLDPGDKSLFCLESGNVQIDSVVNTGSSLRLGLAFCDVIAGATLTACYGETYGDKNAEAWTTTPLETVATGENYRTLEVAVPPGTRYFRIMYQKDGKTYWTATLRLEDYPVVNAVAPSVSPGQVLATTFSSATLTANVIHPGGDFTACDIEFAYGTLPSANQQAATFSGQPEGTSTVTLEGLAPDRTYYVRLRASNASAASDWSDVVSFRTEPLRIAPDKDHQESLPGLWQARVDGSATDWTTDILTRSCGTAATDRRRALGAQMAYCRGGRANDFEPSVTDSWVGNSTWVYRGFIFLETGEYQFRSCMDDTAYLKIGETVVHDCTKYTAWASSSWSCPAAGWYELDLRVGNGTGDAGPMGGNKLEEGFQFSTDEGTTWRTFVDSGDGSFLRTADPFRAITVTSYSTVNGALAARLALAPADSTYTLCLAYGATLGGNTPESWEETAEVDSISGETTTHAYSGLSGAGTDVRYARFYRLDANGAIYWADPIYLHNPNVIALAPSFAVDAQMGDTLMVSGSLASAGESETATVSVLVSTSEDLSDPIVWKLGNYASGAEFAQTLHEDDMASARYVKPGTDYYVAIRVQGANGSEDRSDILSVQTPAGSEFAPSVSASAAMWDARFECSLETYGAGKETVVELWAGSSAETLALASSVAVTDAGPVVFNKTFDSFGTVFYQFRASNSCNTSSWTDQTAVASLVMQNTATYYWKAGVTGGDWSDPANWENDCNDSRLQFPNDTQVTASFERCADATIAVALDGDYTVKNLTVGVQKLNLTLQGTGTVTSRLHCEGSIGLAQDEIFQLDNAYLRINNAGFSDRCSLRVKNKAYLHSERECSMGVTDASIEITDDATMYVANFLLRMNGTRPLLRLHNGTFTQPGTLAPNSNGSAIGTRIEFSGTHPYLAPGAITPSEQNGSPSADADMPIFNFIIPEEGFEDGSRVLLNGTFPGQARIPIRFEIDKASPWFRRGKTKSFRLVKANGIRTDYVDFSEQPRAAQTRFYYTYGNNDATESDGNAPTGLWAEVKGLGLVGFRMIVR